MELILGEDTFVYSCTNTVVDEEAVKIYICESGKWYLIIKYYDAGNADSLIVWFHGKW